jgi:hypothetical protein
MSTKAKRIVLVALWTVAPKAVKGALYRAHRAKVVKKLSSDHPYN